MSALRLGTRGSALALAQAREVAALLEGAVELVTIATAGDADRGRGDKSRWVGALEAALEAGEIDLAVHSAKDVPGELAAGTEIVATPRRASPFDMLVGAQSLAAVARGARVGTSSVRRRAQLLAARPDLEVRELRGNVDTRLAKQAAGEVDALVLAAAGLERLRRAAGASTSAPAAGQERRGRAAGTTASAARAGRAGEGLLTGGVFVPAPGQGVIAVQARAGSPAADAAAAADHPGSHAALDEERAAVRALEASCHTPVGVLALDGRVHGFAGLPDGSAWMLDEAASGEELAARMLAAGAADLLRDAARLTAA